MKNVTVSLSCGNRGAGRWFVSIQTEREVKQPIPNGSAVGIDMGIARFATLSDGSHFEPLNSFKRHEIALRKAQQAMSHKVKFSSNWKKAKARRQLDYKLAWSGGHLIAVPPQNTSRTCPCCDHVSADNRQTQARFGCVECGFEENADLVGAINVLRAGHARIACGVSGAVRPPAAGTHRSDSRAAQCRT